MAMVVGSVLSSYLDSSQFQVPMKDANGFLDLSRLSHSVYGACQPKVRAGTGTLGFIGQPKGQNAEASTDVAGAAVSYLIQTETQKRNSSTHDRYAKFKK
ncbi:unnamed protein product [Fusarium venenatum]|uniref:Uncharacterized protein n=1 Tax=Fusarium venenatum TaxID=56646 RepID=A0A2L2TDW9_9HYPO|nr:uncharacterized protein FVRRES_07033 [Fusarium venenatum]CEI62597.1 unnamed protein product [Fusarium venenatum]